jgi:hypothetical protein
MSPGHSLFEERSGDCKLGRLEELVVPQRPIYGFVIDFDIGKERFQGRLLLQDGAERLNFGLKGLQRLLNGGSFCFGHFNSRRRNGPDLIGEVILWAVGPKRKESEEREECRSGVGELHGGGGPIKQFLP